MTERIYISVLQGMLHYKDRRSVQRWCRNNGVRILCDIGTNKSFVIRKEFEIAYNTKQNSPDLIMSELPEQKKEMDKESKSEQTVSYEQYFLKILQNI